MVMIVHGPKGNRGWRRHLCNVGNVADEYRVAIRSRNLMRDVILAVDRIHPDATIDDNCFTLLPGESRELVVRSSVPIEAGTLSAPPVFQCANRFGF